MSSRNPINSSRNSTVSNEDNARPGPSQIRPATENNSVIFISSDDEAIPFNTAIEIVTDSEDDITPSSNSHKRKNRSNLSIQNKRNAKVFGKQLLRSKGKKKYEDKSPDDENPDVVETLGTQIHDIRETLTCPICFELMSQPFMLPACGHFFCGSCLKICLERSRECPSCRSPVNSRPTRGYLIQNIIDIVARGDAQSGSKPELPQTDDQYWSGLFPVAGLRNAPRLRRGGRNAPPLAGGWALPRFVALPPPVNHHMGYGHQMGELLQRGCSAEMIIALGLSYSDATGITGSLDDLHVHLGWIIPEGLGWHEMGDDELYEAISMSLIDEPEQWQIVEQCVYRLVHPRANGGV